MHLSDFDYSYPPELVAHYPPKERDASRMLVLNRLTGVVTHKTFKNFPDYFEKGDVLVLNNSKVFPCRLITQRKTGGQVEVLLLREVEPFVWEVLLSPSKKIPDGTKLHFSDELSGEVQGDFGETRRLRLFHQGDLYEILERIGHVPLPPYMKREDQPDIDRQRYQTVYAKSVGSVAAPTAGFHLTPEILSTLKAKGVYVTDITLHVGIGTFLPIRTEQIHDHRMHGEFYQIPQETVDIINENKKAGRRISVIGTTAVRALESAWDETVGLRAGPGYTEKFIRPPYAFKGVDRLLTNFHQPKSTLLVLVSAFAGKETIFKAYGEAISQKYRLFSYGDCLWIL